MIKGFLVAAALSALVYLALVGFAYSWSTVGDELVLQAIGSAEVAYEESGRYPQSLAVPESKVWGVFAGPDLTYRSDESGCQVMYWQWPWGPYKGKACNSGGWQYEE